jgi:phage protein U
VKFDNSKTPIDIEIEDDGKLGYHGDDDEEIEISGVLSAALTGDTFMIGDQVIKVNNSTEFDDEDDGNSNLQSLISNAANVGSIYLEAEGHFENGMLVAEEVELEDDTSDNNECTGTVSNLVVEANQNNIGSFTLLSAVPACDNLLVNITNDTIMEDDSVMSESKFNLTHLADTQTVEVYIDPTTGIAIKLERE